MKASKSTVKFEDLPDFITVKDYAAWTGLGVNYARAKFHQKGFPLLKGAGKRLIANKYEVMGFEHAQSTHKKFF